MSRKPDAVYCIDWTEQAHHLSAVGRVLTTRLLDLDVVDI